MWPFGKRRRGRPSWDADGLADLDELRARVAALEVRWAEVDLEWQSFHEKFRTLYARLNKRVERETKSEPDAAPINPAALRLLGRQS